VLEPTCFESKHSVAGAGWDEMLTHQIGAIPMRPLRPVGRPATSFHNSKAKITPLNLRNSGVDLGFKRQKTPFLNFRAPSQ
jgi:hypothetical protein